VVGDWLRGSNICCTGKGDRTVHWWAGPLSRGGKLCAMGRSGPWYIIVREEIDAVLSNPFPM